MKRNRSLSVAVNLGGPQSALRGRLAWATATAMLVLVAMAAGAPALGAAGIGSLHPATFESARAAIGQISKPAPANAIRTFGGRGQPVVHHPGAAPEFHFFRKHADFDSLQPRPAIADHATLSGLIVALPGREQHSAAPATAACAAFQMALPCECFGTLVSETQFPVAIEGEVTRLHARAPPGAPVV